MTETQANLETQITKVSSTKTVVVDTNILLDYHDVFSENRDINFVIHSIVCEELDAQIHARGRAENASLSHSARLARNSIKANENENIEYSVFMGDFEMPYGWDEDKNDNQLIGVCHDLGLELWTNDLAMQIKAQSVGVKWSNYHGTCETLYKGYIEVILKEEDLALHYENPVNKWGLCHNQYLIIKDSEDNVVDKQRWTDDKGFVPISNRGLKPLYFDDIKPKDAYQQIAIDSLNNTDFTLFAGRAGSGKTILALGWAMQRIHSGKIGKLVIAFNPAKLKNATEMGFYSGNRVEKLMQSSLGGILISKFGDVSAVETLISQGKLMLMPMADIRGVEISKHDCLFVTEAQNTDAYLMRTVLQRPEQGCKIIVEGDLLEQVDIKCGSSQNGMRRAIDVFKGTPYFSCVKLKNVYRNPIAEIADRI